MADDKPIIIIKKKGGHGGHHGGAWKVAYADFVTAMMAFFMVMWLVNTADQTTKQNIASYFRRPGLFQSGSGTPLLIGEAGILPDAYVPPRPKDTIKSGGKEQDTNLPKNSGTDEQRDKKRQVTLRGEEGKSGGLKDAQGKTGVDKDKSTEQGQVASAKMAAELKAFEQEKLLFEQTAQQIREQIASSKELRELLGIVDVKVESDGLNIEIMDTEKSSMFSSGSARILPDAQAAFQKIGDIISKLPYNIDIVGHTDSKPFSNRAGGYSNWELSSDRANSARRLLESEGIDPVRIISVVGRADKDLKYKDRPMAASNRRITLKMRFKTSSKVIKLSEDPSALDGLDAFLGPGPASGPEIPAPAAAETQEKTHELTPKKVLGANDHYVPKNAVSANQRDDLIQLPDSEDAITPAGKQKDKIFGDSPVVAPSDPFASF